MKILKAYDVPPNLLQANETMYMGTRAKVSLLSLPSYTFCIYGSEISFSTDHNA